MYKELDTELKLLLKRWSLLEITIINNVKTYRVVYIYKDTVRISTTRNYQKRVFINIITQFKK